MAEPAAVPRTACAASLEAVLALLRASRVNLSTEHLAQRDIDHLFAIEFGAGGYFRERRLDARNRPDFQVGGVVVEVKHWIARPAQILGQLERYAGFDEVTHLVLATGRSLALPGEIGGKPVFMVNLGAGWL